MKTYAECREVREEFSALLDGELSLDEREAVEAHLAECSDCLRLLDGLKRVDTAYRKLPPVAAPDALETRIRAAIRPHWYRFKLPRIPFPERWHGPAFAGVAVFLVLLSISVGWLRVSTDRSTPNPAFSTMARAPQAVMSQAGNAPMADQLESLDYTTPAREQPARESGPPSAGPVRSPSPGELARPADDDAVGEALELRRERPTAPEAQAELGRDSPVSGELLQKSGADAASGAAAAAPSEAPAVPPQALNTLGVEEPDARAKSASPIRKFRVINGIHYEQGYNGQKITAVERGSPELRELFQQYPDLAEVAAIDGPVVFHAGDRWYHIPAPVR